MRLRDVVRERPVWGLVALVLGVFYRPLSTETFYFRDLYLLFYPKKLLFAQTIRSGLIPWWDPFTNGGQPFLTTPSNFSFHPSNILYLVLPTLLAFNLILVLHVLFCAVAAYWLARTVRLSQPAAFAGAVVFAFCGYTLSTANLTPLLLGLPWVPMTIGLTHRALRDGRSLFPAGIAMAMPLFGSAAELTAMLGVTLVVWAAFAPSGASLRARLLAMGIVPAIALGLSLVVTLPAANILSQSTRGEGHTYVRFANWSVAPQRLPELIVPRFLGNPYSIRHEGYWGRDLETGGLPYILSLYFGIPALLLALAAVFLRSPPVEIPVRALGGVAAAGIVLSLGSHLAMFRLIYDYVPLVTIFRFPVKAQLVALFPVSILAATGMEMLVVSHRPRRIVAIVAMVLSAAMAMAAMTVAAGAGVVADAARALSFLPLTAGTRSALALSFTHAAAVAAVFAIALFAAVRLPWAVACAVTLDLVAAGYGVNRYAPRTIFDEPSAASFVRKAIGGDRFYSSERPQIVRATSDDFRFIAQWQMMSLDTYTAAMYGIPVVFHRDYDGLAPRYLAHFTALMPSLSWEQRRGLLDRAGVRIFVTPAPVPLPNVIELAQIEAPEEPLRVYLNRRATAVRFVSSTLQARDDTEAMWRVARSGDLSLAVLTDPAPPMGNCGSTGVRVVARSFNEARYEVDAPCDGLVVFAENHYNGWRARVDGAEVAHVRADYAWTSVPVRKGRHTIERQYSPPHLQLGVVGTMITALTLLVLARRSAARRERDARVSVAV